MDGITVIGIGNPIMTDDGVGLAVLAKLVDAKVPGVKYIDGGTSGMEILPDIQDATRLLVLDGIKDPDEPPGTVLVLEGDQLPRLRKSALSPHQVGLLDLLSTARLLGSEPEEVVVVGVVAQDVELHVGMTEKVAAAVPVAVDKAKKVLASWTS
ncbi:hydrogenase 2 maturation protease [Corynebacterium vitaeruminis DSM 20294]|uniref:Hydrogenase 2 maturation protease n=2 Tax=Corynebacterium vitaeruminis TaxID=38305 RepID=W5Y7M1_9CORY|nr:hydrogenase maturation protease [Corynebacterium vitaeruminis]AHI22493.1 hydrogenase 2 maturation protease [Corynebacterium vitaeruminis DSM 20294]